jgi:hypothetical protein
VTREKSLVTIIKHQITEQPTENQVDINFTPLFNSFQNTKFSIDDSYMDGTQETTIKYSCSRSYIQEYRMSHSSGALEYTTLTGWGLGYCQLGHAAAPPPPRNSRNSQRLGGAHRGYTHTTTKETSAQCSVLLGN